MCFVPQPHAQFRHLGLRMDCFVHFDLESCFVPQRHALFRHLNFQQCSEGEVFLVVLVQFFISHLATWLCTRRFSEPPFGPSGTTNHWKKQIESRLSYFFVFFLHSFSSLIFSLLFSTVKFPSRMVFATQLFCCSATKI